MDQVQTIRDLRQRLAHLPRPLGFVPTMGALHAGHLALVRAAKASNATTAASIFVNPAQFGPAEDLSRYPRDLPRDLALLAGVGTDIVFTPDDQEVYPPGFVTWLSPEGPPAARLEADLRPGHFRGVATVVAKLLLIVQPDVAYFGQKDAQQLAVVRRMVADLHLGCHIAAVPTVREPDGLALSSRNVYLSPEERRAATVLSHTLRSAQAQFAAGERRPAVLLAAMRAEAAAEPLAVWDYVELAHPDTFASAETLEATTLALVACRIGKTRLIDNAPLGERITPPL
jgi:pantoate--beta-alanine ligase